jgi:hypothetical protein
LHNHPSGDPKPSRDDIETAGKGHAFRGTNQPILKFKMPLDLL